MRHKIIFLLAFFAVVIEGFSQLPNMKTNYRFPWAGGMNSVQFGEVDINCDGIKDLVVFDRQGNRIMPFINHGIANTVNYSYAPEFTDDFPELFDWAIFVDYNNDGKADIFTYSPGWAGMKVYKNISENSLKFKVEIYPYLTSQYSGGEVNILVTYADYPAISDLDNDGDLDILTFWGLGSFVEMHKNMSMETYGNADSLTYMHTETCWGRFAESDESNVLYLDTCVGKEAEIPSVNNIRQDRHTGSTFLMMDLDADNDKDLLLADVDYPGMFALINGGDPETAFISEIDTLFPQESNRSVRLFSMPVGAYIDINNDDKKDLLVAPFDPSPFISKNLKNVYVYLNSSENNNPHFSFYTDSFLQNNMIDVGSGAMPVLFDIDKDGLKDLFIGNYGYYQKSYYDEHYTLHTDYKSAVFYFKNIGTSDKPVFKPVDFDYGNFLLEDTSFLNLFPAFGDIDNDGNIEMIVGNNTGTLIMLEPDNSLGEKVYDYADIDVGEYSAPQLFDLDNDGLLDLIIGKKDGKLSYYHNEGTAETPSFMLVTDYLGEVDVTDYNVSWYGYSIPCFFRLENGETRLIVGSETGKLLLYKNIDNNLTGIFELENNIGELIGVNNFINDRGYRSAAAIANLDNDTELELIAGNFSGGLEYFGGNPEVLLSVKKNRWVKNGIKIFPNPAKSSITVSLNISLNNAVLKIYSEDGKLVREKYFSGVFKKAVLNVANLINGVYIIKVFDSKHWSVSKFVVEH